MKPRDSRTNGLILLTVTDERPKNLLFGNGLGNIKAMHPTSIMLSDPFSSMPNGRQLWNQKDNRGIGDTHSIATEYTGEFGRILEGTIILDYLN